MPILTATSGDVLLKPGLYDAELAAVDEREDGSGRRYLVWVFTVTAGPKSVTVRRPTSMAFGPKSVARGFVEAALGRKLQAGETVDTETLIGLPVKVVIGRGARPDGSETNRIETVLPADGDADDEVF